MAVGLKAQPVGKALLIETKDTRWSSGDRVIQTLVIPNLPDEYGKKSGNTIIVDRSYDPSYSRNSWGSFRRIPIEQGYLDREATSELPASEERYYGYYGNRSLSKTGVELPDLSELSESQKAEAHANLIKDIVSELFVQQKSHYDHDLREWIHQPIEKHESAEFVQALPIEITDKDMTDLNGDYKVPPAVVKRIMNARKRPL